MMDQFLDSEASLNRLIAEYEKHGSLCIGVDFDGTLHDYHKTGASHEQIRSLVRDLYAANFKIVIWTAHPDIEYVEKFLKENNIPYHNINGEAIPLPWKSPKPFFNALLDDRAGLLQVAGELVQVLAYISSKK